MGDPITTGMMIGAAGGALTNKNPLQGAMMGGALGAAGGAFTGGAMGAGGAGGGFAGGGYGSVGAAPTFMQQLGGGLTGVKDAFGGVNAYMNQNPVTSQIGMGLARDLMAPEQQMPYAPQGQIQRGQAAPPMDYMSLLNPQQQSVIRPQSISLLG